MERKNILNSLPDQYRPLSPWAYFGLSILFSIPVVGLILLIVFSFNKKNINRRNFARSYFCGLLLFVILIVVAVLIAAPYAEMIEGTVENIKTIAEVMTV